MWVVVLVVTSQFSAIQFGLFLFLELVATGTVVHKLTCNNEIINN